MKYHVYLKEIYLPEKRGVALHLKKKLNPLHIRILTKSGPMVD
jgi:hypothetical protein